MAKNIFITTFFILLTTYSVLGQVDTTIKGKKTGFSMFAGLGAGGNDLGSRGSNLQGGYAKGISARFHYGTHTISAYTSHVTTSDKMFSSTPLPLSLDAYNFGLTYGIGTYLKHFSAGCLVGVGYTSTKTISGNATLDFIGQTYRIDHYNVVNACVGLHASAHLKHIGIGYQVYYNLFGGLSSFTALLGLEMRLK